MQYRYIQHLHILQYSIRESILPKTSTGTMENYRIQYIRRMHHLLFDKYANQEGVLKYIIYMKHRNGGLILLRLRFRLIVEICTVYKSSESHV